MGNYAYMLKGNATYEYLMKYWVFLKDKSVLLFILTFFQLYITIRHLTVFLVGFMSLSDV